MIDKNRILKYLINYHFNNEVNLEGWIYSGKVVKIVNSINAIFINCGSFEGFLPIKDSLRFNKLRVNDPLLVQIKKNPKAFKKGLLSEKIAIRGIYLIVSSREGLGSPLKLSRKIPRSYIRNLGNLLKKIPGNLSVLVRSSALNFKVEEKDLIKDLRRLEMQWFSINKDFENFKKDNKTGPIYQEKGFLKEFLQGYYPTITNIESNLIVNARKDLQNYSSLKAIKIQKIRFLPLWIYKKIATFYEKNVPLKNLGFIVIDAMEMGWGIDVNTGSPKNKSVTVQNNFLYQVNLEAVNTIFEQVISRDLYGIIVIDFINLKSKFERYLISDHLRESFLHDFNKVKIKNMDGDGIVLLIRQSKNSNPPLNKMNTLFITLIFEIQIKMLTVFSKLKALEREALLTVYNQNFLNLLLETGIINNLINLSSSFNYSLKLNFENNFKPGNYYSLVVKS